MRILRPRYVPENATKKLVIGNLQNKQKQYKDYKLVRHEVLTGIPRNVAGKNLTAITNIVSKDFHF